MAHEGKRQYQWVFASRTEQHYSVIISSFHVLAFYIHLMCLRLLIYAQAHQSEKFK